MQVIEQAVVQVLCLCRNYVLCASGGVGGTAPGGGRHHLGQVGLVLGAWVPNATATNAAKSWPDFSTGLATFPVFRAKKGPLALRRPFCWKTLATYNKYYKGRLGWPTTKWCVPLHNDSCRRFSFSCICFLSPSRAKTCASAQNCAPISFSFIF